MQQQKIKKENPFGVLYHIRSKADTDSKFSGNSNRIFQGKKLSPCKGLTAWVRWGIYCLGGTKFFGGLGMRVISIEYLLPMNYTN